MNRIKHHIVRLSVMSAVVVAAVLPCSCERDAENVSSGLDVNLLISKLIKKIPTYNNIDWEKIKI